LKSRQLEIARLAVQVCGQGESGRYTYTQFALDIGIDRINLKDWVMLFKAGCKKDLKFAFKPAYANADLASARQAYKEIQSSPQRSARGPTPLHQVHKRAKGMLRDTEYFKRTLTEKSELAQIPQGVKNELVIKLRQVIKMLES